VAANAASGTTPVQRLELHRCQGFYLLRRNIVVEQRSLCRIAPAFATLARSKVEAHR
jgi:hypothetical protein